jgi:hypothetical protein
LYQDAKSSQIDVKKNNLDDWKGIETDEKNN